jgi:hypothetical protein
MRVDKDDVFTDDKVWEFKQLNLNKNTHIRTISYVDSLHPSAITGSHQLQQHTLRYMSSNGGSDLAYEPTAGAYADSASGDDTCILNNVQQAIVHAATKQTASQL